MLGDQEGAKARRPLDDSNALRAPSSQNPKTMIPTIQIPIKSIKLPIHQITNQAAGRTKNITDSG